MSSQFYIVHHHIKPNMAGQWWEKLGALMSDAEAYAHAFQGWVEMGFYNHSFMPMGMEGPVFCIWEVKDGISAAAFQDFIDGPHGVNLGLKAINNNLYPVNLELTGGQTPYERQFS